jgi:heat-inducible transcriptional repressor
LGVLTERKDRVLRLIVDGYIESGAPVASMALARDPRLTVSSATIRNDMGSLEEDGYITRPHASAGGVPADKGYRYFVEALSTPPQPGARDLDAIRLALDHSRRDVEEWADAAAAILAGLLGTLAFVSPPKAELSRVKQLELLQLQDFVVMLVVILHETAVLKQLISLQAPATQEEVRRVRDRVVGMVAGKTASEIASAAPDGGPELESLVLQSTVGALRERDAPRSAGYALQGIGRLLDQPELNETGYGGALMDSLADQETLPGLAARAPDDGSVAVVIGEENPSEAFHRCSVVVCRYGIPRAASGVVGLIAPTRMEYRRALPVVNAAASLLGGLVAETLPPERPGESAAAT